MFKISYINIFILQENVVNFKLIQTILLILAKQLRLLQRRVEVNIDPNTMIRTTSSVSITEVKLNATVPKRRKKNIEPDKEIITKKPVAADSTKSSGPDSLKSTTEKSSEKTTSKSSTDKSSSIKSSKRESSRDKVIHIIHFFSYLLSKIVHVIYYLLQIQISFSLTLKRIITSWKL